MSTHNPARIALADIRDAPLSVDEVMQAVADPRAGAVSSFVGVVREQDSGQPVRSLDYSAHPSATTVLRELTGRLGAREDVVAIAAVHRVGHLEVGDVAVVCAVSSGHRAQAFEVCRELIDTLKATVPIWKHQVFADGSDEWVGLP